MRDEELESSTVASFTVGLQVCRPAFEGPCDKNHSPADVQRQCRGRSVRHFPIGEQGR